jgi:dipeptidyl aminopeptidase/acylaminoacyl peptidase
MWRQPYHGGDPLDVTTFGPDQPISDFAVAPDRRTLAYRTGDALIVANQNGGVLLDSDAPAPAEGAPPGSIAWSPEGTQLAYSTGTGLRLAATNQETPREVSVPLDGAQVGKLGWSHDGRWLAALAAPTGAKAQLVLVDTQAEPLAAIVLEQYYDYLWLNDGTLWGTKAERERERFAPGLNPQPAPLANQPLIGIASPRDDGRVAYMDFGLAPLDDFGVLSSMNPDGSDLRVEGERSIILSGTIWAPGGRRLLVRVANEGLRISDAQSGANAPIPGTEQATLARWAAAPPPEVRDASGLQLPADLYFLVGDENSAAQVWRLPRDGGAPSRLTEELGGVVDFAVSPDGQQIAYTAGEELYVAPIGGGEKTTRARLTSADPNRAIAAQPAWSPDGTHIAYVQDGIWVVPAAGGEARQMVADERPAEPVNVLLYQRPSWSPDGEWLLVWEQHWEGNSWAVVNAEGGEPISIPDSGVPEAHWTPDNRILLASSGGAYTLAGLDVATPGDPSRVMELLGEDWLVQTARLREDGRIGFLATPGSFLFVPVYRPYSIQADGEDLRPESDQSFIMAPPLAWSPDGKIVASVEPLACCPPNGVLMLTYLEVGQQVQLAEPRNATQVVWGK